MQIKEGKCYLNREGKKIGPMIYDPYATYCWRTASDFEGRWDDQGNDGNAPSGVYSPLTDLVSECASNARESPVRTVTRKEIIPGLYGKVSIHEIPSDKGGVRLAFVSSISDVMRTVHADLSPTELREAIETLSTIADALENE